MDVELPLLDPTPAESVKVPSLLAFFFFPQTAFSDSLSYANTRYFFWATASHLVSFSPSGNWFENHSASFHIWIHTLNYGTKFRSSSHWTSPPKIKKDHFLVECRRYFNNLTFFFSTIWSLVLEQDQDCPLLILLDQNKTALQVVQ